MKIRISFHKSSYAKGESMTRTIRAAIHEWPASDRRKLMRSLALDWGTINSQKQYFNSKWGTLMYFDCSNHGGAMLWVTTPIKGWDSFIKLSHEDYPQFKFPMPWYVYAFEEDCAWSIVYLSLPKHLKKVWVKDGWPSLDAGQIQEKIEIMTKHARLTKENYYPTIPIPGERFKITKP